MNGHRLTWAVAAAFFAGCAKQETTLTRPPLVNPPPAVELDVGKRVADLKRQSDQFTALAGRLPGGTGDENRRLLQQAFAQLAQLLPVLAGPGDGGVFQHQLSIVNDTRTQLVSRSPDLSIDPIVDNGLRAVRNALTELAHARYYEQTRVAQALDGLNAKTEELDAYAGPSHPVAVAAAARQAAELIGLMSDTLAARVAESDATPASAPATRN